MSDDACPYCDEVLEDCCCAEILRAIRVVADNVGAIEAAFQMEKSFADLTSKSVDWIAAAARYRKALEELKDAAATYREAADKPCGDRALDMVRLAFIEAFNTIDAIATRALEEGA